MPSSCRRIESLVTPYVDGELAAADRDVVERHVRLCPPCRSLVEAEQAVHETLGTHRAALTGDGAPAGLAARCAAAAGAGAPRPRRRLVRLALAATLVLAAAATVAYRATAASSRLMAAELTADHVKCFMVNEVMGTAHDAAQVTAAMHAGFGWDVQLPAHPEQAGLELVGSRPCLYAEGRVAHIMYRYRGRPVSIFMLPKTSRTDETLEVMGHEAAIWSTGDRTFVLIASEPKAEMTRLASFVHGAIE